MFFQRPRLSFLLLLIALSLTVQGCYFGTSRGSNNNDDDDASDDDDNGDDDDASGDDDDASGDDDDATDDDDDDDATDDDDDTTPPHGDDDDDATDDDDITDDDDVSDDDDDDDDDDDSVALPAFEDDCGGGANDDISGASGLAAIDGQTYTSVQACSGEVDYYVTYVPADTYVSVRIEIDGSGSGSSDLDLYEVDDTGSNGLQVSWSEQSYERLAVFNPTSSTQPYYWAVQPYSSAVADYDIEIQVRDYHEGYDCDAFFSDTAETGPCNEILQVPRNHDDADGYFVEHQAHYSNLRREVQYLLQWAAEETAAEFPGTTVLSMMDLSEEDGSTPGAMVSSLRHPAGTHIDGNDADIAYYQTDGENNGQTVCPDDGQFCTSPPNILDAERTAYYMAQLFTSPHVRVVGVDTMIAPMLFDAADDLVSSGQITSGQRNEFDYNLAYGSGWPFHQHHLHFSWDWEDGWNYTGGPPDGCMLESTILDTNGKVPAFPLL